MLDPDVLAYYDEGEEQSRLARGSGRLEAARTRDLLTRHLPPSPAVVLDVGGGPGEYAVWLAGRGYAVHLVDPVPLHLQQAEESAAAAGVRLASVMAGDARALAAPDRSVDAVLLLGPLYHLPIRADRLRALAEAARVLRPGGVLLAVGISRFASLLDGLGRGWLAEPGLDRMVEEDLTTGVHRNPDRRPGRFTTAYFHHPADLAAEVREAGFPPPAIFGVEGPGGVVPDLDAWLDDPPRRELLLSMLRRVEAEPALLGASSHLLAVAVTSSVRR
jgi:ubiquinone/menaquinone biosynthesis C-methylase UbiE